MSIDFYMDHHVQSAITQQLRQRGVDVLTTVDDGAERLSDAEILSRATLLERVVFSQDRDFLILAKQWCQQQREFSGIVYAHHQDITIRQAVSDLELIAKALDPKDLHNRVEFLPY